MTDNTSSILVGGDNCRCNATVVDGGLVSNTAYEASRMATALDCTFHIDILNGCVGDADKRSCVKIRAFIDIHGKHMLIAFGSSDESSAEKLSVIFICVIFNTDTSIHRNVASQLEV